MAIAEALKPVGKAPVVQPNFHAVFGNRDYIKVGGARRCFSTLLDPMPTHWLTSLCYLRTAPEMPIGRRIFDCGAWSYRDEPEPRYSAAECLARYMGVATSGDTLVAPDHMITRGLADAEEARRIAVTLREARAFIERCPSEFEPMAVTHGSSIETRLRMVSELVDMGYRRIGIGGIAIHASRRRFPEDLLSAYSEFREASGASVSYHVLGVSALTWLPVYVRLGMDSYDGSSMFFEAFTGAKYYWSEPDAPTVLRKFSVRGGLGSAAPRCDCRACSELRADGVDTRMMGSNEHNMGRAAHNVGVYLRVREAILTQGATKEAQGAFAW